MTGNGIMYQTIVYSGFEATTIGGHCRPEEDEEEGLLPPWDMFRRDGRSVDERTRGKRTT